MATADYTLDVWRAKDGQGKQKAWEMHTKFWSKDLKGRDKLKDDIKVDLRETGWKVVDW